MIQILQGDCREMLARLPDASVHCCITSPPYLGLRDYGVPATVWGGDDDCDHEWGDLQEVRDIREETSSGKSRTSERFYGGDETRKFNGNHQKITSGKFCQRCGAWLGAHGLEPTPDLFVTHEVMIFREVWRVLRNDGVMFVNMGDGYSATGKSGGGKQGDKWTENGAQVSGPKGGKWSPAPKGLKPKDLMMMPARVAMALQADGWFLRSQMPWIKRSCMPESVTDRPASAVEYVYLLTKSQRYFWDATAVKRVGAVPAGTRAAKGSNVRSELKDVNGRPPEYWDYSGSRNLRNSDLFFDSLEPPHGLICDDGGDPIALDVNTQPFPGSHFAVFPSGLVEPLIRAGTSEKGCCSSCGAPWKRLVTKKLIPGPKACVTFVVDERDHSADSNDQGSNRAKDGHKPGWIGADETIGWEMTCQCNAAVVPCTVLDPFAGAFTSMLVADRLQRDGIGIELSEPYCEMARRRLLNDAPLLTEIAKAPQRPRLFS